MKALQFHVRLNGDYEKTVVSKKDLKYAIEIY